jgi:hypothetical protein
LGFLLCGIESAGETGWGLDSTAGVAIGVGTGWFACWFSRLVSELLPLLSWLKFRIWKVEPGPDNLSASAEDTPATC